MTRFLDTNIFNDGIYYLDMKVLLLPNLRLDIVASWNLKDEERRLRDKRTLLPCRDKTDRQSRLH